MSRIYSLSDLRFIKPAALRSWFDQGCLPTSGKFAVVDVRDSDYVGGHIKGGYHYPSNTIDEKLPELQQSLYENKIKDVVFHCMLSQARGPKSSLKFLRSLNDIEDPLKIEFFQQVNVWVLQGGFSKWQESYGEDSSVTESYDKDLWKFGNIDL